MAYHIPDGFYPSIEEHTQSWTWGRSSQMWPAGGVYVVENGVLAHQGGAGIHLYLPMAHRELPFRLAQVEDADSARRFAAKYGVLGYSYIVPPQARLPGDPLDFFLGHARQVRVMVSLIRGLQKGVKDLKKTLLNYVTWEHAEAVGGPAPTIRFFQRASLRVSSFLNTDSPYLPDTFFTDEGRVRDLTHTILATVIDPHLDYIRESIVLRDDRTGLIKVLRWRALLDVVYWHLSNLATGGVPLAICAQCGAFFQRTVHNQRFCPPTQQDIEQARAGLRYRAQSSCGLQYHVGQYRKRKKEAKNE